jgi:hypothetical protein
MTRLRRRWVVLFGGHGVGGQFSRRRSDFFVKWLLGVEPPDWNGGVSLGVDANWRPARRSVLRSRSGSELLRRARRGAARHGVVIAR